MKITHSSLLKDSSTSSKFFFFRSEIKIQHKLMLYYIHLSIIKAMGLAGHVTNSVPGYQFFFSMYKICNKNKSVKIQEMINKGIWNNLLKLLIFIKIFLYHYEYSRHKRPVSVIFYSFPKVSRRFIILRWEFSIQIFNSIFFKFNKKIYLKKKFCDSNL